MRGQVTVRSVGTSRDLRRFIRYPWKIYRGKDKYKNWVPPLLVEEKELFDPEKYPFHQHAEIQSFLAYRDNAIVGRVSGVIDQQYLTYREDKTAYFGFYESIDDYDVSRSLFDAVENWAAQRGMKKIIGPISPTPNHILGLLIDSFDIPPVIQTPYNPPYYAALFEKNEYAKEKDHFAYYLSKDNPVPERITRVAGIAKKRKKMEIRPFNMKRFREDVEIARTIYNDAWEENSDFVPWTDDEFLYMAKKLRMLTVPNTVLLGFIEGEPAGIIIPLPDINEILIKMNGRLFPFGFFRLLFGLSKTKLMRLAIMGVRKKYRNSGLDAVLIHESHKIQFSMQYIGADMSLIIEDNHKLINMMESWGMKRYRNYRVYEKSI